MTAPPEGHGGALGVRVLGQMAVAPCIAGLAPLGAGGQGACILPMPSAWAPHRGAPLCVSVSPSVKWA